MQRHSYALIKSPTIFDYRKSRASCECGWTGPYHRPTPDGEAKCRKDHDRHQDKVIAARA